MKVKLTQENKSRLEVEVDEDLLTLFTVLQREALEDERVVFAAYKKPHPLFKRVNFAITVKEGYEARDVLLEILTSLRERLISYLSALKEQLSGG